MLARHRVQAGGGFRDFDRRRKTVAPELDEAGLSARQIADHLGHSRPRTSTSAAAPPAP